MQLLGQDIKSRGIPYSPGGPQAMLGQLTGGSPRGALPSIKSFELEGVREEALQGQDTETARVLKDLLATRTSDERARGHGPSVPNVGLTSAEPESTRNPFKILGDAMARALRGE